MKLTRTRAGIVAAALISSALLAPTGASAEPGPATTATATAKAKATAPAPAQTSGPAAPVTKPVKVMTRNLYLGTDIFRPLEAAQAAIDAGKSLSEILDAVAHENHVARGIVDATNFPVRARLLASEVKKTKPDLIGLQEVALWRSGPLELEFGKLGVPNAETVDYDYLAILLDALKARNLKYKAVVVGNRADVEAPAYNPEKTVARDVRLSMRDVILVRKKQGLKVVKSGDRVFAENLPVSLAGIKMNFDRGYQWIDVKRGKTQFRFINTHLEAASSDLALAQAGEINKRLIRKRHSVVMVCDCNSDPLDNSVKDGESAAHKAPYEFLTTTAGLTDQWLAWPKHDDGFTSGLSEMVNDASPKGFDHRIDLVLAKGARGAAIRSTRGWITGNTLDWRDSTTGLWPSDHAGVTIRLQGFPTP